MNLAFSGVFLFIGFKVHLMNEMKWVEVTQIIEKHASFSPCYI